MRSGENIFMNKRLLLLLILLTSFNLTFNGQSLKQKVNKAKLIAEIDSILQSQVDRDKIPGAVIVRIPAPEFRTFDANPCFIL